jgi:hypothetical protein
MLARVARAHADAAETRMRALPVIVMVLAYALGIGATLITAIVLYRALYGAIFKFADSFESGLRLLGG